MQVAPFKTLSIPDVRAAVKGQVIAPDDEGYDQARTIFPGGIDRRPEAERPRPPHADYPRADNE